MKDLNWVEIGDLVKIEPIFFGYDNIPSRWHDAIFIVIKIRTKISSSYNVCSVLTPEGSIYDFYDYELSLLFYWGRGITK